MVAMTPNMMQPGIILLKDGTDTSQGIPQICANISACLTVADIVRTTLGPRGMDKLIHNEGEVTITNDGATVMQLLDIVHPAAKILVDISQSQDDTVGDGTTSVVLICGQLLKEAREFVEDGVAPQTIVKGYRRAVKLAVEQLRKIAVSPEAGCAEASTQNLIKCAETTLTSKLVADYKVFFAQMVVDAVNIIDTDGRGGDVKMIGYKNVPGGSVTDSKLVQGVAFKKCFSYAGFEQCPKSFDNPKVLLLNVELELKAEKDNAEIRLDDVKKYQEIVDAEWKIIYDKLDRCANSGAKVVLSRLPVGDLATQYFADHGIFCAGRVEQQDMLRAAAATGGVVQSTTSDLNEKVLGTCGKFRERQIGKDRYNVFEECKNSSTATIILRGGAEQFLEESQRSLHDAIMIVRRCKGMNSIVGGGGSVELELSRHLRDFSRSVAGKDQLVINAFAKALEVIPRALANNSGGDPTEILNSLRQKHASGQKEGRWYGVDCINVGIQDCYENFIWEPLAIKLNAIQAAADAACTILSIDETIQNQSSYEKNAGGIDGTGGKGKGKGKGKGMRR